MASTAEQPCRLYSLADIQLATENFDDGLVIGSGGFGKVYKGQINGERDVAIKRLDSMSDQGAPEFRAEIDVLSKLRHAHLVSLLGCCDDGKEMILVYEYMPNGTLYHHLHKSNAPLSWMQRLMIGIGAARGLDYLHTGVGTKHGIIHRDVKSSNILLDDDWVAKISDFGLAKLCPINQSCTYVHTVVKGTFGYLDPATGLTGNYTRKTDVFAFGVVLFELLSGRLAVFRKDDEELSLARWAQNCVKERKLDQIVSAEIRGTLSAKSLKKFVQIGHRCLHSDPKERPTMSEVVVTLQLSLALALQEKFESGEKPAGLFGLTWKMPSYTLPPKDENSGKVTSASVPHLRNLRSQAEILKTFSYNVLKQATQNFRSRYIIGIGAWGSVHKGWIDEQSLAAAKPGTGTVIAVKILNKGLQGHEEWLTEINYLGQLNHPNLVNLIGYCLEDDHRMLVYEYIPRGSLENHLFRRGTSIEPLSWNLRIKVSLGAAKGLAYLHSLEENLIYGDFNTSDILIDSNYNAKLSDFWCAKDRLVNDEESYGDTRVGVGTNRYEAPEYIATGHFVAMSDIYSFGVVLLEILTGRRCVDRNRPRGEQILVEFAMPYLTSKRRNLQIMDPRIAEQYSPNVAMRVATLATKCLLDEPKHRPTVDEVVKALEQLQELQKATDITRKEPIQKHRDGKPVSYPIPAGTGSEGLGL